MLNRPIICIILFLCLTAASVFSDLQPQSATITDFRTHRVHELMSASGLANSQRHSQLLWSHNDSGYEPLIYALTTEGQRIAEVRLTGLPHVDYEDISSFKWNGKPYLALADSGDNDQNRKHASIHILPEPLLQMKHHRGQPRIHAPTWTINYVYEDGPKDVEAIAIDLRAESILLLTKRHPVPKLYRLPLFPQPFEPHQPFGGNKKPIIAKRIATLPHHPWLSLNLWFHRLPPFFNVPTAIELSQDGQTLYVLTYLQLYAYTRAPDESWRSALKHRPRLVLKHIPLQQAEGLTRGPKPHELYIISEGYHAGFMKLNITTFSKE